MTKLEAAAVRFVQLPENWEAYQELKGSNSHSIPVEFMDLCEEVEKQFPEQMPK